MALIAILSGCAYPKTVLETPEGHKVTHSAWQFGTVRKMKRLKLKIDGVEVTVEGYESDALEGLKAGVAIGKALAKP